MAQYKGTVDDYLKTTGALEVATEVRVLPVYNPETAEVETYFKIDVSERGGKEIDKVLEKNAAAIRNAQTELIKVVDRIKESGGGQALVRRPKQFGASSEHTGDDTPGTDENQTPDESATEGTQGEQPVHQGF